jgi:hypothetical protein
MCNRVTNKRQVLTEMARQIRSGTFQRGLVLANGGVLSHQHAVCLSSQPRKGKDVYPKKNPLPGIAIGEAWGTPFKEVAQGAAFIEVGVSNVIDDHRLSMAAYNRIDRPTPLSTVAMVSQA